MADYFRFSILGRLNPGIMPKEKPSSSNTGPNKKGQSSKKKGEEEKKEKQEEKVVVKEEAVPVKKDKTGDSSKPVKDNNKRRNSLSDGGLTSSNSSTTDSDEACSEGHSTKCTMTSPPNEMEQTDTTDKEGMEKKKSPADAALMLAAIDRTASQVTEEVLVAGQREALKQMQQKGPVVSTGLNGSPLGIGGRKVATPTGRQIPSPEIASFRSLADDYPLAIPTANLPSEMERVETEKSTDAAKTEKNRKKKERKARAAAEKKRQEENAKDDEDGRKSGEYNVQQREAMRGGSFGAELYNQMIYNDRDMFFREHGYASSEVISIGRGIAGAGLIDYRIKGDDNVLLELKRAQYTAQPDATFDWMTEYERKLQFEHNHTGRQHNQRAEIEPMRVASEKHIATVENSFLRQFLELIHAAKPAKLMKRLRVVASRLAKDNGKERQFEKEFIANIVDCLLTESTYPRHGHSFVHILSSQFVGQAPCGQRNHSSCMTLDLLLSSMSPVTLSRALGAECKTYAERMPIHFAALTGQPCQMDVLLKHGVNPNAVDALGQSAIHYVIGRDHLCLLRQLMWHGADLNIVEEKTWSTPTDMEIPGNLVSGAELWRGQRIEALELSMVNWMRRLLQESCGNKIIVSERAASEIHIVRITRDTDTKPEMYLKDGMGVPSHQTVVERNVRIRLREPIKKEDSPFLWLCAIPFQFTPFDMDSSAPFPHIVRTMVTDRTKTYIEPAEFISLENMYFEERFIPSRDSYNPYTPPFPYTTGHNGYYYAWRLPTNLNGTEAFTVKLHLNTWKLPPRQQQNVRLMLQVHVMKSKMAPLMT